MADILRSAFAGTFYPAQAGPLEDMVRGFLDCGVEPGDDTIGIVVPHAGYVYSGRTAGYGFASAPKDVSTVVVCAPSHRFPLLSATVFDIDGVETPLGVCPVNRRITGELAESMDQVVFQEHSFEVMVPFIQLRWPGAQIVPLILGASPDTAKIAELVDRHARDALFVASTDLSHFHPLHRARELDESAIQGFMSLSPEEFSRRLDRGAEACGRYPVLTLLHLAGIRGGVKAEGLHYSTSADAGAGATDVVGYFSGRITL